MQRLGKKKENQGVFLLWLASARYGGMQPCDNRPPRFLQALACPCQACMLFRLCTHLCEGLLRAGGHSGTMAHDQLHTHTYTHAQAEVQGLLEI